MITNDFLDAIDNVPKLTIELIPEGAMFKNIRNLCSSSEWDMLRRDSYKKANYKCEICGGVGPNHPVECHEVWNFNKKKRTIELVRLISLCPSCHQVKHIGLAELNGKFNEARAHLMKVNNIDIVAANDMIEDAFKLWKSRNGKWDLDRYKIDDYIDKIVKENSPPKRNKFGS